MKKNWNNNRKDVKKGIEQMEHVWVEVLQNKIVGYDFDGKKQPLFSIGTRNKSDVEVIDEMAASIKKQEIQGVIIKSCGNSKIRDVTWKSDQGKCIDLQLALSDKLPVPVLTEGQLNKLEGTVGDKFIEQRLHYIWHIEYYGDLKGKAEKSKESLLTTGNGYMGIRGTSAYAIASEDAYPATYIAGLYNTLATDVNGRTIHNEDFVNIPNAQRIVMWINGEMLHDKNRIEVFQSLNMQTGVLEIVEIFQLTSEKLVKTVTKKVVDMANMHYFSVAVEIQPLNFSGSLQVQQAIDGSVINAGVDRYAELNQKHLRVLEVGSSGLKLHLLAETVTSKHQIYQQSDFLLDENCYYENQKTVEKDEYILQECTVQLEELVSHTFTKNVYVTTKQRHDVVTYPDKDMLRRSMEEVVDGNVQSWRKYWQEAEVKIKGDDYAQKLLHIQTYHLLVSGSEHTQCLDVSITARGLHGEAYRGHIFWDELFILPFYFHHFPETARSILMYRYRRLGEAKKYAANNGYEGAMYPWQSAEKGDEQTQRLHLNPLTGDWGPDYSALQRHVSLAIAYNVWRYVEVTNDQEFMCQFGAEMLYEIMKFWASKGEYNEQTRRYSIDKVMGPDEFHEKYLGEKTGGVKDNAYTNLMVVWLFMKLDTIEKVIGKEKSQALFEKVGLDTSHLDKIVAMRRYLNLEIDASGIIAQFDGYFELKEVDWDYYEKKYGNIYRMDRLLKAEGQTADAYKVAKQADLLMIFYNLKKKEIDSMLRTLDYQVPTDYFEKNYDYYLQRTSHGSTLSRVVHAQLAHQMGDEQLAWKFFFDALQSDYNDIQGGTTAEGIHTGVMAATIMITQEMFAGIQIKEGVLTVCPSLPKHWSEISCRVRVLEATISLTITHDEILLISDAPCTVNISGNQYLLTAHENTTIAYT